MKRVQQGFTLIELMIVVAIIGILAAIALPAYQDYVVRTKLSETMVAASSMKNSVAEHFQTRSTMPLTGSIGAISQASRYVQDVSYTRTNSTTGVITALVPTTADVPSNVQGGNITLTGAGNTTTGTVNWTCSSVGTKVIPAKYRPSSCK